jgi:hypothetical protein
MTKIILCALIANLGTSPLFAQEATLNRTNATGTYAADLGAVTAAQEQALARAKQLLEATDQAATRDALRAAIQEMARAESALAEASHAPEKLPAAIAAQQAAYAALLKMLPREFEVSRSRNRGQSARRAGEAGQEQINQLEMTDEENRYESERQAQAAPNAQQREQLQIADRLKELAQRQQDLNDRLKELQTTLPEARTETAREEAQRQLKRLSDEERQMLADMDELRQQLEQSPNANSLANTRQQLDQTRSDAQRAAQELANQSPSASQALAAGSRAQQGLENLRQGLRGQTASRFAEQMRQLRSQARALASREDEVARGLESLANPDHKSLDDTAPRQQLSQQMARQQSALTNLLSQMQDLTGQAETTEPLLSQQLYDTLRRESQRHTEDVLEAGQELVDRGLVSQAGEVERLARRNLNELRQGVERAAESVLGNEADSLRFAEHELDDLAERLERELAAAGRGTNSNFAAGAQTGSNSLPRLPQSGSAAGRTNLAANNANGNSRASRPRSMATGATNPAPNNSTGSTQPGNVAQETSGPNSQNGGPRGANAGNGRANIGSNDGAHGADASDGSAQNPQPDGGGETAAGGGNRTANELANLVRQFGANRGAGGLDYGPITGNDFVDWSSRMRDVEQVLDEAALRNQLASARERAAAMRAEFRQSRIQPKPDLVRRQILDPITEVRGQLREDLSRLSNASSLVPLDHDPVPDKYSELVRKYYQTLGGGP